MTKLPVEIPIFGDHQYSFLDVVKHYNDAKVGYDGAIIKYGRTDINYTVVLPDPSRGTLPIEHMRGWNSDVMAMFQNIPEMEEYLVLTFAVPVRKRFTARINAVITPWDRPNEVLASYANEVSYGANPSPELDINPEHDEYAYVKVSLKDHLSSDLNHANTFLQNKLKRWIDNGDHNPSSRLFLVRVQQFVWPAEKAFNTLKPMDFDSRDDSIILHFEVEDESLTPIS